jgi:hypothetical protein
MSEVVVDVVEDKVENGGDEGVFPPKHWNQIL